MAMENGTGMRNTIRFVLPGSDTPPVGRILCAVRSYGLSLGLSDRIHSERLITLCYSHRHSDTLG